MAVTAEALAGALLRSYAQLLFARSRAVGALLVLATAVAPRLFAGGLLAVLLALGTARALRLAPEVVASGHYGYNALLAGLGVAALAPANLAGAALLAVAVVATVLATAALEAAAGPGMPLLTLPFIAVFYLFLGAAPLLGVALHHLDPDPWAASLALPPAVRAFLQSLGAVLFLPRVDAGALVLLALARQSRIAVVLAGLAFAVASLVAPADPALASSLALNGMLVAVALGGLWFVPSVWSYALALAGVVLAVALGLGLAPRLSSAGLPLLILPFNLAALVVLYAMRQRTADGRPHASDPVPGTPEENLARFRARTERFGAVHGLRLAAPFRGRWACSQGTNGGITHEGAWRDALDFEVTDDAGVAFRDAGAALTDYHCYRLPVVAPAAGVVARVVDGVRDNPIGEINLDDNWGNVVVLYHAPGVYSCLAHLSPGSIPVREGQSVRAGEVLGLCGNSGRSATPHLHMQLQATARVGAATLPLALHDVVCGRPGDPAEMRAAVVPARGDVVRNLEPDEDRARLLRFEYAKAVRAHTLGPRGERDEELVGDVDLYGRLLVRSRTLGAELHYERGPAMFSVIDVRGDEGSALHLVRLALARVPFEADDALSWTDRLPLRPLLPAWLRPLFDAASPFGVPASLPVRYVARRHGRAVIVEGASERHLADGRAWVATSACLAPDVGVFRVDVRVGRASWRVELDPVASSSFSLARVPVLATSGGTVHVS